MLETSDHILEILISINEIAAAYVRHPSKTTSCSPTCPITLFPVKKCLVGKVLRTRYRQGRGFRELQF